MVAGRLGMDDSLYDDLDLKSKNPKRQAKSLST